MTELTLRSMVAASDADTALDHISAGCDIIVPLANGEPATLDYLEHAAEARRQQALLAHQGQWSLAVNVVSGQRR